MSLISYKKKCEVIPLCIFSLHVLLSFFFNFDYTYISFSFISIISLAACATLWVISSEIFPRTNSVFSSLKHLFCF